MFGSSVKVDIEKNKATKIKCQVQSELPAQLRVFENQFLQGFPSIETHGERGFCHGRAIHSKLRSCLAQEVVEEKPCSCAKTRNKTSSF